MNLEPTLLEGALTTLAHCCARLGIDPPLLPHQRIVWRGWDASHTTGINAQIDCFAPDQDDEPYGLSIGVYERIRAPAPPGRDYGTDNRPVAVLDFAFAAVSPEADPRAASGDPLRAPLRLVVAAVAPEWEGRPLDEVLDELRQLLAGWPATRERVEV